MELRQSGLPVVSDVVCCALAFAVPSSSSGSFSKSSRRLKVSSEGSVESEELERERDRRYHSSGTDTRKLRLEFDVVEDGLKGDSRTSDVKVSNGMRAVPKHEGCFRIHDQH